MDRDILSVISGESKSFSKGQKLLARYIRDHYDKAAFMTAGKLGKAVGVSESTVVRFASELGYDGYPGMRKALQEVVRHRLTSVQRIAVSRESLAGTNVIKQVFAADGEMLQTTMEELDRNAFSRAVDAIVNAERVYIVGTRSSYCLASYMGFYMNNLVKNVHVVQDTTVTEVFEQCVRIGPGDAFICISYPRYSSRSLQAMEFARSSGAVTIALTDNAASPITALADISLYAKSEMVSFVDSLTAPMSLINALVVAVGVKTGDELSDTFEKLEKVWSAYDVFTGTQS